MVRNPFCIEFSGFYMCLILRIVLLHIFIVSKQAAVWRLFSYLVNENLNAVQMKYILYFLNHVNNQNKQTNPQNVFVKGSCAKL